MRVHAEGTFDVSLQPQPASDACASANLGRLSISKRFQGDLEAESQGEMLSVRTEIQNSAGYVALERVTGKLQGREGTFVLQHSGTMNRGRAGLVVAVVPDSGTAELSGLAGVMTIDIIEGKHLYGFDYTLDEGG